MTRVLMVGQFPPLITGEAIANEAVLACLTASGFSVRLVNSNIVDSVNDVGKFGALKLMRALRVIFDAQAALHAIDVLYMTPGQTALGILRSIPVVIFAKLFRKRVIIHWHGYGLLSIFNRYPRLVRQFFFPEAINVVLTNDLREKILSLGLSHSKIKIIKNFHRVEDGACFSKITKKNSGEEPLRVLYLGSLMPEKGFLIVLEAARRLGSCDFVICGSGNDYFTSLAEKTASAYRNVSYLGQVTGSNKSEILRSSDVFILPTKYKTEGVPLTILEAMASGCAIITTRHNGIPEAVGGAAIFLDANTVEDLILQISALDENRERLLEMKEKSYERSKDFSYSAFRENICDIFKG